MHNRLKLLTHSISKRGIKQTISAVFHNAIFDLTHGTETQSSVKSTELGIAGNHESADYMAVNPQILHLAIKHYLALSSSPHFFVDYGSGKGRALIIASRYKFARILGIEYSDALNQIAARNLKIINQRNKVTAQIDLLHADATTVEFPDDATVAHFYNPFHGTIMTKVVNSIRRSLARKPRIIYIIYINPIEINAFISLNPETLWSSKGKGSFIEAVLFSVNSTANHHL